MNSGIKERIEKDLKASLLAGEKDKSMVLRGLKSAILYSEVEKGERDKGLDDEQVAAVLSKESKKRQESADLYARAGDMDRQQAELREKEIIDQYLPEQLSQEEVSSLVDEVLAEFTDADMKVMGQVIGRVKSKTSKRVDGKMLADTVKKRLSQ